MKKFGLAFLAITPFLSAMQKLSPSYYSYNYEIEDDLTARRLSMQDIEELASKDNFINRAVLDYKCMQEAKRFKKANPKHFELLRKIWRSNEVAKMMRFEKKHEWMFFGAQHFAIIDKDEVITRYAGEDIRCSMPTLIAIKHPNVK